jgi:hypothetical protein
MGMIDFAILAVKALFFCLDLTADLDWIGASGIPAEEARAGFMSAPTFLTSLEEWPPETFRPTQRGCAIYSLVHAINGWTAGPLLEIMA